VSWLFGFLFLFELVGWVDDVYLIFCLGLGWLGCFFVLVGWVDDVGLII